MMMSVKLSSYLTEKLDKNRSIVCVQIYPIIDLVSLNSAYDALRASTVCTIIQIHRRLILKNALR